MKRRIKTPLPAPCRECRGYEGNWRMQSSGGLARCSCPRGRELRAREERGRRNRPAVGLPPVEQLVIEL